MPSVDTFTILLIINYHIDYCYKCHIVLLVDLETKYLY